MANKINVLGIAGSLRKASYNKLLLQSMTELKPEDMEIEIFDIKDIPLYNQDVESAGAPEAVTILKEKISMADGLLIVTPEYNYSLPGVLKNVIDWVSRPPASSPFNMKPLAITGATGGLSGTVRAQMNLRQVAGFTNMMDMKRPELLIRQVREKFDANGKLIDEPAKEYIKKFLEAFEKWILIFKK
jgi:chromate reductase